jgi:hypothetical protein
MRSALRKIKPASGFGTALHIGLLLVLPIIIFVLVRLDFIQLALSVIVLSKWRMLAVRPRFWPANIRANGVDLMVGLSIVLFMGHSGSLIVQFVWAALYAVWLIIIKPGSSISWTSTQAFIGQLAALMALYLTWAAAPSAALTVTTGLICYLAARHFFDSFDEPYAKLIAYLWGYVGAGMAWVLSHWLLYYQGIALPTLLLTTIGYGMASLYYLDHNDRLSVTMRRQFVFIMVAIVLVVLAFADWGNKVV